MVDSLHPFKCRFCEDRFKLLEKRNAHILEQHADLIIEHRNPEGKWVWWQPKKMLGVK